MSQIEKILLVLTISPLILLLIGLIMIELMLGPQTIAGLKVLLSDQMILFLVFFVVAGLIFGQPVLKAMSNNMSYFDRSPVGTETRRKTLIAISTLIVVILFFFFVPALADLSRKSLAETALRLIISGFGLSVMFGTLFVCASVIRIRSQRDS